MTWGEGYVALKLITFSDEVAIDSVMQLSPTNPVSSPLSSSFKKSRIIILHVVM